MKSGVLLGIVALVGIVLLSKESPAPTRPSLPVHRAPSGFSVNAPAAAERSIETYAPLVRTYPAPVTFLGYECTIDCSGHEAGYEWAERKGIDDPDDCGGNSESFIEGCRAYAEEQQGNANEDEDEKEDGDGADGED